MLQIATHRIKQSLYCVLFAIKKVDELWLHLMYTDQAHRPKQIAAGIIMEQIIMIINY